MKINPSAVILWIVVALGTHLLGGNWMWGLFIIMAISFTISFFSEVKREVNKRKRFNWEK